MKYRKFNKLEKKQMQSAALAEAMKGEGLYLYENRFDADLTLPRPTKSGLREVGPRAQFQGDNYYMQLVRNGQLRYIKELISPEQERKSQEQAMNEEKLILDQPDTITEQGKVEHVPATPPPAPLNEGDGEEQQDVLINESPVEDGFVIVE